MAIEWVFSRRADEPIQYLDDVYRYAYSRLGDREDAEDIAIEVVQALPNPCRRRDLRTYMLGMARRKIADRHRKHRAGEVLREADVSTRFDHQADESAFVTSVMDALQSEHREVLVLKYVIGLTSAEVGAVLGKSREAVDSMLQRARDSFETHWKQLSGEVTE